MQDEKQYPFQTITTNGRKYKVFGIVTNRDVNGNDLINWLYERCGESEEVHRAMKDDFARRKAARWWIWSERRPGGGSCFRALNLNSVMKAPGVWAAIGLHAR